jgi:hypothetical protein
MKKLAGIWLLSAGVASGCVVGEFRRGEELTASVEVVHGSRVLTLSHSLMEVAAGVVKATLLRSDLRIGGADSVWFGSVADVAVMSDGRFAVLDRLEKQIVLFDTAGSVVRRIGRDGNGPGEFRAPWALEAVGGMLVSWQDSPNQTFTVLDTTGKVLACYRRLKISHLGRTKMSHPAPRSSPGA